MTIPLPPSAPPRITLPRGLEIPRIVTGLWQVADMERDGRTLTPEQQATAEMRLDAYNGAVYLLGG